MKMFIVMFLSFAAVLAAPVVSRISYLLDIENYDSDSTDTYDYR